MLECLSLNDLIFKHANQSKPIKWKFSFNLKCILYTTCVYSYDMPVYIGLKLFGNSNQYLFLNANNVHDHDYDHDGILKKTESVL